MKDKKKEADDAYDREDYEIAFKKYLPLAEKGHAEAQYEISRMYLAGLWIEENNEEGLRWMMLSAEQGYSHAQHFIGLSYMLGKSGLEKNYKGVYHLPRLSHLSFKPYSLEKN